MKPGRRAVTAFALFSLGLYGLGGLAASPARAEAASAAEALSALRVGEMRKLEILEAPQPATTKKFLKRDGEKTSLHAFRGRVVVLNFWAMWCPPCLKELPSFDRLAAKMADSPHADDFALVAVNIDRTDGRAKKFMEEQNLETLRFYHDDTSEVAMDAGVRAMPTTLLIDRDGNVVARYLGDTEWDAAEALAVIEAMIGD